MSDATAKKKGIRIQDIVLYFFLSLLAFIMLFPMLWMFVSSFKTLVEVTTIPPIIFPRRLCWENYSQILTIIPFLRMYLNSIFTTVVATVSVLFFSTLGGYTFGKFSFPGKSLLFNIIIATMLIPFTIQIVPLYLLMAKLGLVDTYVGMIAPSLMTAFGIFMVRQFVTSIPDEMLDACRIDGCGEFRIFGTIVVPLLGPCLGALLIFTFMSNWDSFLWPLIIMNTTTRYTLPVGLSMLTNEFASETHLIMTGASLSIIPVLIVFAFAERQIIQGIVLTGIKG